MTRVEAVTRNQERKRRIIQGIKLLRGCADCPAGTNWPPEVLEFDHRPGEEYGFSIGRGVSQHGLETLLVEIAKCDVVCANHHRIRSFQRGQHRVFGSRPRRVA